MAPERHFVLHLETTHAGDPLRGLLLEEVDHGQLSLVAQDDFAPFDDPSDLYRWLCRHLRHHSPLSHR